MTVDAFGEEIIAGRISCRGTMRLGVVDTSAENIAPRWWMAWCCNWQEERRRGTSPKDSLRLIMAFAWVAASFFLAMPLPSAENNAPTRMTAATTTMIATIHQDLGIPVSLDCRSNRPTHVSLRSLNVGAVSCLRPVPPLLLFFPISVST